MFGNNNLLAPTTNPHPVNTEGKCIVRHTLTTKQWTVTFSAAAPHFQPQKRGLPWSFRVISNNWVQSSRRRPEPVFARWCDARPAFPPLFRRPFRQQWPRRALWPSGSERIHIQSIKILNYTGWLSIRYVLL